MHASRFFTGSALLALTLAGCGGGGGTTTAAVVPTSSGASTSSVSAALLDAPFRAGNATVSAVNVTIAKVELIGNGAPQVLATFAPSKQINLLDYQTSALQLGTGTIAPGAYQQLRLVLDTSAPNNASVVVNGQTYPLAIPSAGTQGGFNNNTTADAGDGAGTAGIKVNVALDAQAGQTYGFVIDFNAAESILQTGNGQYKLKPVLVATAQANAGAISGTVKNNAGTAVANAEVLAQQNGQTVNSGVTDANGNFQINALPAGSYTLVVQNAWTSQAGASQTATGADGTAAVTAPNPVTVTGGSTTSGVTIAD